MEEHDTAQIFPDFWSELAEKKKENVRKEFLNF